MKGRTLIGLAVQFHRPAMKRNKMTRDGESQSNPPCDAAILFDGHEWFEDAFLLFAVNPEACIRHPEMDLGWRDLCV